MILVVTLLAPLFGGFIPTAYALRTVTGIKAELALKTAEVDKLNSQRTTVAAEVDVVRKTAEAASATLATVKTQLAAATQSVTAARSAAIKTAASRDALVADRKVAITAAERVQAEANDALASRDAATAELADANKAAAALAADQLALDSTVADLDAVNSAGAEAEKRALAAEKTAKSAIVEREALGSAPSSKQVAVAQLAVDRALAARNAAVAAFDKAVVSGAKNAKELQVEAVKAQGDLDAATTERDRLLSLNDAILAADAKVATATSALAGANADIAALLDQRRVLTATAKTLSGKLAGSAGVETRVAVAKKSADDAEKSLAVKTAALDASAKVIASLNSDLKSAEEAVADAEAKVNTLASAEKSLAADTARLTDELASAQKELDARSGELDAFDRDLATAKTAVKKLQVEKETLEASPPETAVRIPAKVQESMPAFERIIAERPLVSAEMVGGMLPPSVTFSSKTGFEGTPTAAGEYTAKFRLSDGENGELRTVTYEVAPADPVETAAVRDQTVGDKLQPLASINKGNPIEVEAVKGSLPEGVTLNGDGNFTGQLTKAGEFTAMVTLRDTATGERELRSLSIRVAEKEAVARSVTKTLGRGEVVAPLLAIVEGNPVTAQVVSGELPVGVDMTVDGVFVGTADVVGVKTAQVMVRDVVTGDRELRSVTFQVVPRPVLETVESRTVTRGERLAAVVPDTKMSSPSVELVEGLLPQGVKLGKAGIVEGAPTVAGTSVARILFTDSVTGDREVKAFTIDVVEKEPVAVARGVVGKVGEPLAAVERLTATHPVTVELLEGEFPAGVKLNADGSFEGAVLAKGAPVAKVLVTDTVTFERELRTISYKIGESDPKPLAEVRDVVVGDQIADLAPINPESLTSFSVIDGKLPEGVSLDKSGVFAGVPRTAGTFAAQVMATDKVTGERELRSVSISVAEKEAVARSVTKTLGRGDAVAPLLAVTEGNPIAAQVVSGELPVGVKMTKDGVFVGTADVVGVKTAQVMVRDVVNGDRELRSVTFEVLARPVIESSEHRDTTIGDELAPVEPTTLGEYSTYGAELVEGSLPKGVTLSGSGSLLGTPSEPGDTVAKVLFTDKATGDRELKTLTFSVDEKEAVAVAEKVAAKAGDALEPLKRIKAENAVTTKLVGGALPDGVLLGYDGTLKGAPTRTGKFVAEVLVRDDVTGDREMRTITFTVGAADPVATLESINTTVGEVIAPLAQINPKSLTAFDLTSGDLPDGVSLDKFGVLQGMPRTAGKFQVQVMATDTTTGERELRSITITVAEKTPLLVSVTKTLTRGETVDPLLAINDGSPMTAKVVGGSLPAGVKMNVDGTFVGVAEKAGATTAQVMVRDSVTGDRELRSINFEVRDRPLVTTSEQRSATVGDDLAPLTPTTLGKPGTYAAELAEGSLPKGVTLSNSGSLLGAPLESGDTVAKVMFTDRATGQRELKTVLISVAEKEAIAVDESVVAKAGETLEPLSRIKTENPVTTTLVGGALPEGVLLSDDGTFNGAPTRTGKFVAEILVRDDVTGNREIRTVRFTVGVADPVGIAKSIDTTVGETIAPLAQINPKSLTTFKLVDGELPEGVSLIDDGRLKGVPRSAGKFPVQVMATDTTTGERELRSITITVAEKTPVLVHVTKTLTRGDMAEQLLAINEGNPITADVVGGSLPAGVKMNADGSFEGMADKAGVTTLQVMVRDSVTGDRELRSITFEVGERPVVKTSEDRSTNVGEALVPLAPDTLGAYGSYSAELAEGSLPKGVTLSESGSLLGKPSAPGDTVAKVMFTDEATGERELKTVLITVAEKDPVAVDETVAVKSGETLEPLTRIEAQNPIEATLIGGMLPDGVMLAYDGTLKGAPTRTGEFVAEILVTDPATHDREIRTVTFVVDVADPVETSATVVAVVGAPVESLAALADDTPTKFAIEDGELPEGVSLTDDGDFEGVALTAGEFRIEVMATDSATGERELRSIILVVNEQEPVPTSVVRTVTRGEPAAPLLAITEGNAVTAQVVAGELPKGLEMKPDGTFDGTADVVGVVNAQIMVRDSVTGERELRSMTFEVTSRAVVESAEARDVTRGEILEDVEPDSDFENYTVELVEGSLPGGITLGKDGALIGVVSETGEFVGVIDFVDAATGDREAKTLTLDVDDKDAVPVSVDWPAIAAGAVAALERINDDNPIEATLTNGTLPAGVTLKTDGTFEGMPTETGSFTVVVLVIDQVTFERELRTISMEVASAHAQPTTAVRVLLVGDAPADLDPINDGNAMRVEQLTGELPAGVVLAEGGVLEGIPTTPGSSPVVFMLTDVVTAEREERTVVFEVSERPATEQIRSLSGKVGAPIDRIDPINGDNPIVAALVSGSLPPGVELNEDGTFTGTPKSAGTFVFQVMTADQITFERVLSTMSITIAPSDPVVTSLEMRVDLGAEVEALAPIAPGNDMSAELVSGDLPTGLVLGANGEIEGTADEAGAAEFTVLLTDIETGDAELRTVLILVVGAPVEVASTVELAQGGAPAALTPVNAGGGIETELVGGALPDGISLNEDGSFNGTASAAGMYSAEIMVTDPTTGEREIREITYDVSAASTATGTTTTTSSTTSGSFGSSGSFSSSGAFGSPASSGFSSSPSASRFGSSGSFGPAPTSLAFVDRGSSSLAFTGAESLELVLTGGALVLAGGLALCLGNRRRRRLTTDI